MRRTENECVGCPPELGCLGAACPNRHVTRLYCDDCGEEYDALYLLDGMELCEGCALHRLEMVTVDE